MRIGIIAPIIERVPPKKYGGIERVVHAQTEELVRRGHDVTLFASGDSATSAKLSAIHPRSLREARVKDIYGLNVYTLLNIGAAYNIQDEFDILHDHTGHVGLPTANIADVPVVMTIHSPFTREMRQIFDHLRKPHLVTISRSQAMSAPTLNHAGTVYNGLPMEQWPFSADNDGYLLFVGRISMEKGVHLAIEAAQELNLPLIIAAKLEPIDRPYFKEYVEPALSDQIRWIGEVDEMQRNELYSQALAMLHPVTWPEPFGLTIIEAMACGCPVIAIDKGSIPELIIDGVTGYVVHDVDEMIEAIEEVDTIDRAVCRRHSLTYFSAAAMVSGYEEVYRALLS